MCDQDDELKFEQIQEMNMDIWYSVWYNDLEKLKQLLPNCPLEVINYKHDSGKTALHTAALNIHLDCAKLLIGQLLLLLLFLFAVWIPEFTIIRPLRFSEPMKSLCY